MFFVSYQQALALFNRNNCPLTGWLVDWFSLIYEIIAAQSQTCFPRGNQTLVECEILLRRGHQKVRLSELWECFTFSSRSMKHIFRAYPPTLKTGNNAIKPALELLDTAITTRFEAKCKQLSPGVSNSHRGWSCEQIFDSSTTFLNPLVRTNPVWKSNSVFFFLASTRPAGE